MPIERCTENGNPGYRCGTKGKCYTYKKKTSGLSAKKKAIKQCIAEGEPISASEMLEQHLNDCEDCE